MMARYIDADKLNHRLLGVAISDDAYGMAIQQGIDIALNIINDTPTADVVEVRHGEWEPYFNEYKGRVTSYSCSLCGRTVKQGELELYCHCGAKMDVSKMEITTDRGEI